MLVTISRFTFPYEAQIAWAKLDAEGIPAFIADEHTINMQWLYSNALGGVRLQVPEEYADQAQHLLSEDRAHDLLSQEGSSSIPCPQCGSTDTKYYQFGKRCAFLVFLCIDFPLYPIKHGIKCSHCGHKSRL
ncbi:DUF2007 domain-containing protein [Zooshikella marina]|uniref:DUF2007 domain-containing protein n=1 Tax=Zooshikella ganghwensis TaxID=202772 RepID=A0A4P9VM19_9GAMM|nr:DUF2007 domain-containing protein [Zooshikella ganghwensis]MBU2705536.1 DUF2007 domain-containing protein [Zooshikella ganghwensis]RDH42942.1 DUF2007 domain-containing protein [Zooshikella ganghwensis]